MILTETEGRGTLVIYEISLQGCYGNRDGTLAQSHSAGSGVRAGATSLGKLTTEGEGHKVWEWGVQESNGHIFQQYKNCVKVYRHIRRGRYKRLRESWSGRMKGDVATVEEVMPGIGKCALLQSILFALYHQAISLTY